MTSWIIDPADCHWLDHSGFVNSVITRSNQTDVHISVIWLVEYVINKGNDALAELYFESSNT